MQLEQSFTLAAEPARVWQAFHDVRLMVECLPGASIKPGAELVDGAEIPLLFKVKLGPIAAGFAGQGQLALDEAAQSGNFSGGAVDAKTNSRVKGQASFALLPDAVGTRVTLSVEFSITGSLAQFSREGIVRALAEQLTRQFADNLQARLPQAVDVPREAPQSAASQAAQASVACAPTVFPAPVPPAAPRAAAPAPAAAIDLWSVLKLWFRGLFARRG
ncbi:SRPBCC family protein [Pseudorhodoferax sp.]|uniref:SRPBCC family protein n=1 Tax=Pseudorhodoferax sp. TaxID=1993553 RepID=UPI002DD69055|nr:SRPBCC family protein [Pseudorhodoferax sp.]